MKKFLKTVLVITLCASFFAGCTAQENIDSKPHWVYRDINVEVTDVQIGRDLNKPIYLVYVEVKSDEYGVAGSFRAENQSSDSELLHTQIGDTLKAEVALYIVDNTNEVQDMEIERLYK